MDEQRSLGLERELYRPSSPIPSSAFFADQPMQGYIGFKPMHERRSLGLDGELYRSSSSISSPAFFADQPVQADHVGLNPMTERRTFQTIREEILPQSHHLLPSLISSSAFFKSEPNQDYIRLNQMPGRQSLEELKRELYEEKVKEEILALRMAQKRMVKEEIRRDMEHEMMMFERFNAPVIMPHEYQFSPHPIRREVEFDQHLPSQVSPNERSPLMIVPPEDNFVSLVTGSQTEFDRQLAPRESSNFKRRRYPIRRQVGFDGQLPFRGSHNLDRRRYHIRRQVGFDGQLPFRGSHNLDRLQEKFLIKKFEGTKRKAELTCSGTKDYSSALYETNMTCEHDLNDHMKGKKYIVKAAQRGKCGSSSSMEPKFSAAQENDENKNKNNMCPHRGLKVKTSVNGKNARRNRVGKIPVVRGLQCRMKYDGCAFEGQKPFSEGVAKW